MQGLSAYSHKKQFEQRQEASKDILNALVDAKAELDAADSQGMTALHCLVECGSKNQYLRYSAEPRIMEKMTILIQASRGAVLFAKNKKGKLASQLVGNKQVRAFLQEEELRLKDVGVMVELRPCLAALAAGLTCQWTEAPQDSLRSVAVSKLHRLRVKINDIQAMFKVLLRAVGQAPPLRKLDHALIRGQLAIFEGQANLLLTLHNEELGDLTSDFDDDEKMASRQRKRVLELTDLGTTVNSLLVVIKELLAVLQK